MAFFKVFRSSALAFILLFMASCGGSGGTSRTSGAQVVSGVAATGAPISGTITLKDKNGVQLGPLATDTDGGFSFDVTGLTPPFSLKADWQSGTQSYTLFSVACEPGRANINPLTNLTVNLVFNAGPSAIYGSQGAAPDLSQISNTEIAAAQSKVMALLSPLLAKYGITDFEPLNGAYVAAPDCKLDAMLDVISISVANGQLLIANKLDGSIIASGNVADIAGMALDMSRAPDGATLTDIREITEMLGRLCSVMNMGTALSVNALEGLFVADANYGTSSSHTRAEDMASIVAIFGPGGSNTNGRLKCIRNVRLVSDVTFSYSGRGVTKVYLLNYDFIHENGTVVHGNNATLGKDASDGRWKFIGDPTQSSGIGNNYGYGCVISVANTPGLLILNDLPITEPTAWVAPPTGETFSPELNGLPPDTSAGSSWSFN